MRSDRQIETLLEGGEWATSWGDPTGLRDVCLELAEIKEVEHAAERARAILDLLDQADVASAFARWADLDALLRAT